jgi:hypothetical protein
LTVDECVKAVTQCAKFVRSWRGLPGGSTQGTENADCQECCDLAYPPDAILRQTCLDDCPEVPPNMWQLTRALFRWLVEHAAEVVIHAGSGG